MGQEDFPHIAQACDESIPQAQSDLNKLKAELNQVANAVKTAPPQEGDKFVDVMTAFHGKAEKVLEETIDLHTKLEKDYKEVLEYFGEAPATESQSFFKNIQAFLESFDTTTTTTTTTSSPSSSFLKDRKSKTSDLPHFVF